MAAHRFPELAHARVRHLRRRPLGLRRPSRWELRWRWIPCAQIPQRKPGYYPPGRPSRASGIDAADRLFQSVVSAEASIARIPQAAKKGQECLLPWYHSVAPFPTIRLDYLAERAGLKVQVPLDGQSQRTSRGFQFRQNKVTPFFFKPDHVAEEEEVDILRLSLR